MSLQIRGSLEASCPPSLMCLLTNKHAVAEAGGQCHNTVAVLLCPGARMPASQSFMQTGTVHLRCWQAARRSVSSNCSMSAALCNMVALSRRKASTSADRSSRACSRDSSRRVASCAWALTPCSSACRCQILLSKHGEASIPHERYFNVTRSGSFFGEGQHSTEVVRLVPVKRYYGQN